MPLLGLLLFFVLEFWVLSLVAGAIGTEPVLIWCIASGIGGIVLARVAARRVSHRVRSALYNPSLQMPGQVAGAFAPVAAGLFIMVPGLLTDVVGISLLIPWSRSLWARATTHAMARAARHGSLSVFTMGPRGSREHVKDADIFSPPGWGPLGHERRLPVDEDTD